MPDPPISALLDTNVFVAAIKTPTRPTDSLRLVIRLLQGDFHMAGNELLATEYLRYAQLFPSAVSIALATAILGRMEVVGVGDRLIRACSPHFRPTGLVDRVHAATCLQTGAILVSNDRDFDRIRDKGIIEVWSITKAMRLL